MRCPLPATLGLHARDRVDLDHVGATGGTGRVENTVLIGGAANIAEIQIVLKMLM
jgi:hypothetical protein